MENNSYCCLLADTCDFIRDSSCPTRKLNQYMMSEPKSERKRNFQCPLCPSSFYRKGDLTQHIRRHLKEKAFPCNQCSYSTWTSSNLCRHVKAVHEELAPFECSFSSCNYRTVHNGHLQRHHRTHSTDPLSKRPFPCDFDGCDYRATQKATLTRHIRSRHSENREKNFDCSLCPRRFYEKSDLQRHINEIHLKETTYSCSKCPYKSSRQCQVSAHLQAVHGEESKDQRVCKPRSLFPCDFRGWGYSAAKKPHLTAHIQRRQNEARSREFACALCQSTFFEKTHLQHHINNIHTKETTYSCIKCPCQSSHRGTIKRPLKTIHPDSGRAGEPMHGPPEPKSSGKGVYTKESSNVVSTRRPGSD